MRAAYITGTGPAEAIQYGDLPEPEVGQGQVLIDVEAVTVDPIDTYIRSGAYRVELPTPFIVGRDVVGVVRSTGQRVWANNQGYEGRQGTFAERLAVDADLLYPLPDGVEPQAAVAALHSALTAVAGLERLGARAGQTLFINGGSGNVGTAVTQLAHAQGLRVAVTAGSTEKAEWLRSQGASLVIDYHHTSWREALREWAPQGLDLFWEASRGFEAEAAFEVMAPGGRLTVMAGLQARCALPVGAFYTKNLSLFGFTVTSLPRHRLAEYAAQINGWLARGVLRPQVHSVLALSETARAHALVEEGVFGKIVLVPR